MSDRHENGEQQRPEWFKRGATFVPELGTVETVTHHRWIDMNDWRFHDHGEQHIIAEGYDVN